jgi:hypothetical protein
MKNWQWIVLGLLFLISLILEFTVLADYDSHWWNAVPAFYALWGFVCTVVLVFAGKFISTNIVKRDPDYYDR